MTHQDTPQIPPLLITLAAAAAMLGRSQRTLERWIAEGKPHPRPVYRVGKQLMVRPESVHEFVANLEEVA